METVKRCSSSCCRARNGRQLRSSTLGELWWELGSDGGEGEGEVRWGADVMLMYKRIGAAEEGQGQVRGMRDRFAVNKSNYQGRSPRPPNPGRSQFPVEVQSLTSPRGTRQGSRGEGLVAREGVMWEQGFRAKDQYVPLRNPSAPHRHELQSALSLEGAQVALAVGCGASREARQE